jgi:hypothetical protein
VNKVDLNFVMKISQIIGEEAVKNDSKDVIHLINHFYTKAKSEINQDLPIWRD